MGNKKKKKKKKNLKGNRLYTIADNVTIIDKLSYILSACINTISYNDKQHLQHRYFFVTQNPLMQYNARRYAKGNQMCFKSK